MWISFALNLDYSGYSITQIPRYFHIAFFEYRCIWISQWISLSSNLALFASRLIRNLSPTRFIRILLYLNITFLERHLLWMVHVFELRRVKIHCKIQGFWSVGHNCVHPYRLFCTPGPANPVKYKDFETLFLLKFWKVLKTIGFYSISSLPDPQEEAKMGSKMRPRWGPRWAPRWGPRWDTLGSQKWPFRSRGSTNSRNLS